MDRLKNDLHYALVKGVIDPLQPIPVRVHIANPIFDITGISLSSSWPIKNVMERMSKEENGIIVILSNQVEPETVLTQIRAADKTISKNKPRTKTTSKEFRTIGLGSQILSDLGVQKMIAMSSPKRFHAISGFGLEIIDYINE
jgi:3,4-dihydroxy 2-butanone 4-phosphate synthase/GTP cyclohydrolase II